jgi:ubiquinone/menaquinone biosynthesis C-methylase UbiE
MNAKREAGDAYVGRWVFPEVDAPLEMVGRKGVHDLDWLANYIAQLLQVNHSDRVLDLCCGNGLITVRLANRVRHVTAVDFSRILLAQAEQISNAANVEYLLGDACAVSDLSEIGTFDKIFVSAGFQYFNQEMGYDVLTELRKVIHPNGLVAITDIPDRRHKFGHELRSLGRLFIPDQTGNENGKSNRRFSSASSRFSYFARQVAYIVGLRPNSDIGWWWRRDQFVALARRCGFVANILDQPEENPHHRYRFDALMRPC